MQKFKVVILLMASMVSIVSGYYVVKNYHYSLWTGSNRYTDFEVYYKAGVRFTSDSDSTYITPGITPETGGTYNYPPLAMLYFAPVSSFGYVRAYTIFSVISIVSSFVIAYIVLLIMREYMIPPTRMQTIATYLLTASFTPVWQDMKHGQVNALVAMCVLLFMWLMLRQQYGRAAFILFMGFWLKIYSALFVIFVLPFLFRRSNLYRELKVKNKQWSIVLYFILAFAVPPLVLSPFIPLSLYKYYFIELLPHLSRLTNLSGFNQSIYGVIARYTYGEGHRSLWEFVPIEGWVKILGTTITLAMIGYICRRLWHGTTQNFILSVFIFMAFIPIISQYGWEYVYVFALPLVLMVLLHVFSQQKLTRYSVTALIGLMLFWIPKPSAEFLESTANVIPLLWYQIFSFRWIVALLLISVSALVFFKEKPQKTANTIG